jgi:hypothetical protein
VSWPNTEAIGKFGDRGFIQESFLDKTHTARHRRCSPAPRRTSRCSLGSAAKAWSEACSLRGGCRTKEHDIRRASGSHWTDRTAVDPRSSNAREEYAIKCPVSRQASAVAYGVVGETPNLAARLQALAAPNTLVIAEATRRQIGGLFDLADLGPQALAGFAEPQPAWRVIGESGMLSRFEALRSGETPLVGREEEVELLVRRWQQAKTGAGRVVLISGEPGIGKSRLTAALSEHVANEPHTRLRYFCSPHHQDSALYSVIVQLERIERRAASLLRRS